MRDQEGKNLIWSYDRANPSQLQNEKAVWSESIPTGLNREASLRCRCPLQPRQCRDMMKKDLGESSGSAMFMRKGITGVEKRRRGREGGRVLKMER